MTPSIPSSSMLPPEAYWIPRHLVTSAWLGHAPFGFWTMAALRPDVVVELGTHNGFSFFVWCEAAERLGLATRVDAIDTWKGDEHAGFYGDEVHDGVKAVLESDYPGTGRMLRGYFDDWVDSIPDGSVDLLHIDGRHGYDDVKHDFESYLPKVSSRGLVLFHDIAETERGFEVHRFWDEISQQHPSFAFQHEHGLGVLGVGLDLPEPMAAFLRTAPDDADAVRDLFRMQGEIVQHFQQREVLVSRIPGLEADLADRDERIAGLSDDLATAVADAGALRTQLEQLHASTSWKVTKPIRALGSIRRG